MRKIITSFNDNEAIVEYHISSEELEHLFWSCLETAGYIDGIGGYEWCSKHKYDELSSKEWIDKNHSLRYDISDFSDAIEDCLKNI